MNDKVFDISSEIPEPELFKKMIFFSLVAHVTVVVLFGVKALIFPSSALDMDAAIRVDMVDLPDKIKTATIPQALIDKEPPPQPAPSVPKIEENLVLRKMAKKDALNKIKQMAKEEQRRSAIERIEREVREQEAKKFKYKGNAISAGTALRGLPKAEFNEYIGNIHTHISEHWNLPEWLQNDSLKATVIVHLDHRGYVISKVLEKPSVDARFNDYVLKAVDSASPFPPPPPKFVDIVRYDGIALRFPQ